MPTETILYERLVNTTESFLGPAAQRFIDRQIQNHLNVKPRNIDQKELEELIDWLALAIALLTDDNKVIRDYKFRLKKLVGEKPKTMRSPL